jgi:TatA/E family protein of Tat protein translocase
MNLGFSETAFLVVLGLLLFGPKKLPEIGRTIGKFMAEFKRASAEFQNQLNDEVRQLEREVEETKQTILPPGVMPRIESYFTGENSGEHAGETIEAQAQPESHVETPEKVEQTPISRAVTQGPNA